MFDRIKSRLRRWLADDPPAAAGPSGEKAPRSATLTSYMAGNGLGGATPAWNDTDTRRYFTNWVYAACRAIGQRIAGQPVRVGRVKAGRPARRSGPGSGRKAASNAPPWLRAGSVTELDSHPLLDALADPNPFLTQWGLLYLTAVSLELAGVAYLWLDEQPDGSTRIWYLPAGWVSEDPEAPEPLSRFLVRPAPYGAEQFALGADELIRFSLPDPANPLAGLGPLKAGALVAETDREVVNAQFSTFKNGALPGLLVTVGRSPEASSAGIADRPTLTRAQRNALTQLIRDAYTGTMKAGDPLILDAMIQKVEKLSNTPAEMDFLGSGAVTKERILQLFGVNAIVIGQVEGANRASATVADEHFCFSTLAPLCTLLGQTLTKWMRVHHEDPDLVVWIDPPRPRDPDGRRADLDQLARHGSITVNELRAEHGLDPIDGGEVLVKAGPAPAAVAADPPDRDDRPAGGKGLILPEPGWGRNGNLWDMLSEGEKLGVYHRSRVPRG